MRFSQALLISILVVSAINIVAASSCLVCNEACKQSTSASYYYNSTDSQCYSCPAGCLTCDNPNTCSVCGDGYILSSNKTCIPCLNSANCLTCDTSTLTCSVCQDGFYIDSSGACERCPWPCVLCTESSSCLKCSNSSYNDYYIDSNSVCQLGSVTGCSQYTSASGACEACHTGYAFSSGSCVECPNHCDECDATDTTCTKCSPTAYYDHSLSRCMLCSGGCKSCTSGDKCLECGAGFVLNQNGGCSPCSVSSCKKCSIDDTNSCLECNSGSVFDPITKSCTSCPTGCKSCSVGTYDTDNGMCLNTTSMTSEAQQVRADVGGALGAVAGVFLIAGIVMFMKLIKIQKALSRLSMPNSPSQNIPQERLDTESGPLKGNHTKVHPADSKQIGGQNPQFTTGNGLHELETEPQ